MNNYSIPRRIRAQIEARKAYIDELRDKRADAIRRMGEDYDARIAEEEAALEVLTNEGAANAISLDGWVLHDGGPCPVAPRICVHFRVKMEWAAMLDGDLPSLSEDDNRSAGSIRWEWDGNDWDDIAAYRIVVAQGMETAAADETAQQAQPEG